MTAEQSNQLEALYNNLLESQEKDYNVYCSVMIALYNNAYGTSLGTKQVYFYIYKRGATFTSNITSSLSDNSSWKLLASSSNGDAVHIYGFKVHSVQLVE